MKNFPDKYGHISAVLVNVYGKMKSFRVRIVLLSCVLSMVLPHAVLLRVENVPYGYTHGMPFMPYGNEALLSAFYGVSICCTWHP